MKKSESRPTHLTVTDVRSDMIILGFDISNLPFIYLTLVYITRIIITYYTE